jgi:PAS domain S-box-containing protein
MKNSGSSVDAKNYRILIIDDEPANLSVVVGYLTGHGFQIVVARNGEAGVRLARQNHPALILLDVQLPGIDGFEACRRLKADERTRQIPVIFMTVLTKVEDKVQGFEAGGVDYISKPFQKQEVLARVTTHLRLRELTRDLEEAKENLEQRVVERTSELAQANVSLKKEIAERRQAEEALRRERDLVARITETSPVSITMVNREGQITFANARAEQVLGLTRDAITGRTFNAPEWRITGYDGAPFPDEELPFRRVMSTRRPVYNVHHAIVWTDGRRVLLSINGAPLLDESRQVDGVVLTMEDITERKQAEEALHRLNRELRALSNCNQVLMRAVDEQTLLNDICRIICAEAGYRLAWVGYAEHDEAGSVRPVAWAGFDSAYVANAKLSWADDTARGRGPGGTAIRSGEVVCIQDFTTDPRMTPWRESALPRGYRSVIGLPLKDSNAHPFGVLLIYSTETNAFTPDELRLLEELAGDLAFGIAVLRDRTRRKQAEEELRESEQRYRRVFENSPVSIWEEDFSGVKSLFDDLKKEEVGDIEIYFVQHPETVRQCAELTRIVDVNRAALTMHGAATKAELLAGMVSTFTPESFDTFRQELACLWHGGTEMSRDAVVKTLAGELRQVTVYFSVCPGYERTLSKVLVSLVDITGRKQAEETLKNTATRLNEAQRLAHIGSWELNLTNNVLTWSDEIFRMFELDPGEFGATYEAFLGTIHPDDREAVNFAYTHSLETRTPYAIDHRLLFPEGRIKYVHEQCETFYDGDKPIRSIGIVQDITERKLVEQERLTHLRFVESMDQINRAIQGTNDLDQMMSDALEVVLSIFDCDRAFLMYPCDPEAATWTVPMERNKPEYPDAYARRSEIPMDADVARTLRELLASDRPVKFGPETKHPLPEDMARQFGFQSFMSMAIYPKVDKPWQFGIHQCAYPRVWTPEEEWLFQEIGRRLGDALTVLLAYQKLQQSEERLRLTTEAARIGIWDWDVQHDCWYASPIYYIMLGYVPSDDFGERGEWLERLHPDDKDMVAAKIERVLARDFQDYRYEARIRHADGAYRWVSAVGFDIQRDQDGQVTRMLGVRMDITDRKRAEEEIRRLNQELEQRVLDRTAQLEAANKELEAFTYSVAHDLRAPLRHIDGFIDLLQQRTAPTLDAQSRHYMATISDSAKRMGTLVDELLAFSWKGRYEMSKRQVDLGPLVQEVIRELAPETAGRKINWHVADLPTVTGDLSMLRLVLVNLISNALKFTRGREPAEIEIGWRRQQEPETVIFVRDNGVGFDMQYADKLFGVFQHLHRVDEFEGIGIGLANVRRIITRHGGRTWAEGEVNRGATFYFSLPSHFQGA